MPLFLPSSKQKKEDNPLLPGPKPPLQITYPQPIVYPTIKKSVNSQAVKSAFYSHTWAPGEYANFSGRGKVDPFFLIVK